MNNMRVGPIGQSDDQRGMAGSQRIYISQRTHHIRLLTLGEAAAMSRDGTSFRVLAPSTDIHNPKCDLRWMNAAAIKMRHSGTFVDIRLTSDRIHKDFSIRLGTRQEVYISEDRTMAAGDLVPGQVITSFSVLDNRRVQEKELAEIMKSRNAKEPTEEMLSQCKKKKLSTAHMAHFNPYSRHRGVLYVADISPATVEDHGYVIQVDGKRCTGVLLAPLGHSSVIEHDEELENDKHIAAPLVVSA